MTNKELITIGYDFTENYLHSMDIYISDSYLTNICKAYHENITSALSGLNAIVKEYTSMAAEIAIKECMYYYYFRENFSLTEYKYKRVFELGRFLWYISIEKEEFLRDIKETLDIYL